ncbi:MAG: chlororespiratory reduction protein 7 [Synechococcales bacterium]|nr:chlororespiratory reduction protein 7 [Synechococcales bacterium]
MAQASSSALMYAEDHYVLLETSQPEVILSQAEILMKLQQIVQQYPEALPPDVQGLTSDRAQAQQLLNTVCELDLGRDRYLQWYAIRLEK